MSDHSNSQELYLLSDKNPNPVISISAGGEVVYYNPASLEQWPWLAGKNKESLPEEWPAIIKQVLYSHKSIDKAYEYEGRSFSCIFVPVAALKSVTVYGHETTPYKRAEEELLQRNRELMILQAASAAVSSSLDLYHIINAVANEMVYLLGVDGCILYEWNPGEDTISILDEYSSNRRRDRGEPGEIFSLNDYPGTRQVLIERRVRQVTLNQKNISPAELRYMQKAKVQTLLILPMIFQDNVTGLIEMVSQDKRTFTDQSILLAQLLANQAASAIENAHLYERVHQRVNELAILSNISQAINSTLDLQEMMNTITDLTAHLMGVEATSVALYHELDRGSLWYVAASGEGADFVRGARLAPGQGITGWVVEHGQAVLILDVSQDPRFLDKFDQVSGFKTRSMICVPMKIKDETIGAISVINKKSGSFSEDDLQLLNSLAPPAAIAIEHARLFKQAQLEISERKRAEAALAQERALLTQRVEERTVELSAANAELTRAARLKDEFLANMSHELRTPLHAILGKTEALQELVYGSLNEGQQKSLKRIEESGHHLLSLINDILDLSKAEAGKIELDIRRVAVESICRASLRLIKETAHRKQIKISSIFDPEVKTLQADARRLKQILVNLLSNAVKFTQTGGQIGLEVVGDAEQRQVHFIVWDTGIGIAQPDIERLFEPFVQLDSSLSRQYQGTGLGLSLVYRMVKLHNGGISVESVPGDGSRFTVSMAWQQDGAESLEPESEESQAVVTPPLPEITYPQLVILLVEDNEDNIEIVSDYLSAKGYRIIVTRDGHEAIKQVKETRPDIILMDVQIPGMSGLDVIRYLRSQADSKTIPIITMTALTMPGDRERCLAEGADDYLSKPVSLRQLVTAIQAQLA